MKKRTGCLAIGMFCLPLSSAALAGDDELLTLAIDIHEDGKQVSSPVITLEPGGDGSVHQGLRSYAEDDLLLKMAFHSTHLSEEGADVLLDVDIGLLEDTDLPRQELEHLESRYVAMRWNEPYEFVFSAALDAPSIHLSITPSRVNRSDLLLRPEKAPD